MPERPPRVGKRESNQAQRAKKTSTHQLKGIKSSQKSRKDLHVSEKGNRIKPKMPKRPPRIGKRESNPPFELEKTFRSSKRGIKFTAKAGKDLRAPPKGNQIKPKKPKRPLLQQIVFNGSLNYLRTKRMPLRLIGSYQLNRRNNSI